MRWIMLAAWLVLLLNSTVHVVFAFYKNLYAFMYAADAEAVFVDIESWVTLIKVCNPISVRWNFIPNFIRFFVECHHIASNTYR